MKSNKTKALKWLKIGGWILGVSVLLFVGLFFFTDWLQNKLERTAQQTSNGLYGLELHGLEVSPFIGNLSVDSLRLKPDYKRWQQLQQQKKQVPRLLFELNTHYFSATGLNFFGLIFGKSLQADDLELISPDLILTAMRPDTTERAKAAHETVTGMLKNMGIGQVTIRDASVKYRKSESKADYLFNLANFTLEATEFKLDSQSYAAKDRVYYSKKITLEGEKATYLFPDGLYRFTTDSISLNTAQQTLFASNLYLKPLKTAGEMSAKKAKAVTSNDLKVDAVKLRGLNYGAYFREKQFIIQHAQISNPALKVFKSRKTGQPEKKKPTLHEMVQQVKTPFLIDSLQVKSGYIRYSELAAQGEKTGYITLNNLSGTVTNLSNMPAHISDKNPAVLQSRFLVMDKAEVNVTLTLPLLNKAGYHTIQGTIGEARPAILNPILVPVSYIKVESGYLRKGEFRAQLTSNKATGRMLVYYNNLEVELLNKGEGGDQGLGKKLISEVADWVAIKDANPMNGEKPRTGKITVTRNPNKSILDYWKNCVVSGFLSTMGLEKLAQK